MGKHSADENKESTDQRNARLNRIRKLASQPIEVDNNPAGSDLPPRGKGMTDGRKR